MALSAAGIGSGLDVNTIVQQLMQLEQRPLLLLAQREASFQARLSSLGSVKGVVAGMQTAAQALAQLTSVSYRATTSDSAALGVTTSSTATGGVHTVDVTRIAQGQKLVAPGQAARDADIGAGGTTTVTLTLGTITGGTLANGVYSGATFTPDADETPATITINASNNTLEGIRDAINAAGAGVTATIVNDGSGTPHRLALATTGTGAAKSMKIGVTGDPALAALLAHDPAGAQNLVQTQTAQDAELTVDGVTITRSGNVVSDVIAGTTLTLKAATEAPATVTVARDNGGATTAVQNFVKAYNDFGKAVSELAGKGRPLQGDTGLLGLQQRLRGATGSLYGDGDSSFRTLSSLGVTFQLDGTLAFDSTKLSAALNADTAGTLATLAGAGGALKGHADAALGTGGVIGAGTDRLNASIETINERRAAIERRLVDTEKRLRTQFTALDTLVARMNSTSNFLTQQLATLANLNPK